jgi:hypothetical protein
MSGAILMMGITKKNKFLKISKMLRDFSSIKMKENRLIYIYIYIYIYI